MRVKSDRLCVQFQEPISNFSKTEPKHLFDDLIGQILCLVQLKKKVRECKTVIGHSKWRHSTTIHRKLQRPVALFAGYSILGHGTLKVSESMLNYRITGVLPACFVLLRFGVLPWYLTGEVVLSVSMYEEMEKGFKSPTLSTSSR